MIKIIRTDRFISDVRYHIIYDLADKNPIAANKYLNMIDAALCDTSKHPYSKQEHLHLGPGIRKIFVLPYVILYRIEDDQFQALRFLHSHQDMTMNTLKNSDN